MSYDSHPDDPPFAEDAMTPPRAIQPWLSPLDVLKQLGAVAEETAADAPIVANFMAAGACRTEDGRLQVWRAAIDIARALLAVKLGDPDDAIDDEESGFYSGGWIFERGSLMIDSTESDVSITVTRYSPMWHWTWQLAGQVSPPYAPVVPLPVAAQEAVSRLVEEVPGARRRDA